jgi:hypothetical protein
VVDPSGVVQERILPDRPLGNLAGDRGSAENRRTTVARVQIDIEGRNLPGARCHPDPDQDEKDIYVGMGSRGRGEEFVSGGADTAHWTLDVIVDRRDGILDFKGRLVEGRRGERFIYLNWGTLDAAGEFVMFRRAKLMLSEVDPGLIEQACEPGTGLRCVVNLTDAKGHPRCARVRPPDIEWLATPVAAASS